MTNRQLAEVQILNIADLGEGNIGEFGPASEVELQAVHDVRHENYWGPLGEKSGCMDDRLEGLNLKMAGNRAVSEAAGSYMDRHTEAQPLSVIMGRKVKELDAMGRTPVFHKKCAALASIRQGLKYNGENEDEVVVILWPKLDAVGATEFLTEQQLRTAIKTGAKNAEDDSLWDVSPEQLMEIAEENGAEIEETAGEHHAAGNLDNLTFNGFNNGLFRADHQTDDGEPMGLLTIDWVGYRQQLYEDGFSGQDAAVQLMRSGLFIVGIQKMINKEGSPVVAVTQKFD